MSDQPMPSGHRCDYCGVDRKNVRYLVRGETGLTICDECLLAALDALMGFKVTETELERSKDA